MTASRHRPKTSKKHSHSKGSRKLNPKQNCWKPGIRIPQKQLPPPNKADLSSHANLQVDEVSANRSGLDRGHNFSKSKLGLQIRAIQNPQSFFFAPFDPHTKFRV